MWGRRDKSTSPYLATAYPLTTAAMRPGSAGRRPPAHELVSVPAQHTRLAPEVAAAPSIYYPKQRDASAGLLRCERPGSAPQRGRRRAAQDEPLCAWPDPAREGEQRGRSGQPLHGGTRRSACRDVTAGAARAKVVGSRVSRPSSADPTIRRATGRDASIGDPGANVLSFPARSWWGAQGASKTSSLTDPADPSTLAPASGSDGGAAAAMPALEHPVAEDHEAKDRAPPLGSASASSSSAAHPVTRGPAPMPASRVIALEFRRERAFDVTPPPNLPPRAATATPTPECGMPPTPARAANSAADDDPPPASMLAAASRPPPPPPPPAVTCHEGGRAVYGMPSRDGVAAARSPAGAASALGSGEGWMCTGATRGSDGGGVSGGGVGGGGIGVRMSGPADGGVGRVEPHAFALAATGARRPAPTVAASTRQRPSSAGPRCASRSSSRSSSYSIALAAANEATRDEWNSGRGYGEHGRGARRGEGRGQEAARERGEAAEADGSRREAGGAEARDVETGRPPARPTGHVTESVYQRLAYTGLRNSVAARTAAGPTGVVLRVNSATNAAVPTAARSSTRRPASACAATRRSWAVPAAAPPMADMHVAQEAMDGIRQRLSLAGAAGSRMGPHEILHRPTPAHRPAPSRAEARPTGSRAESRADCRPSGSRADSRAESRADTRTAQRQQQQEDDGEIEAPINVGLYRVAAQRRMMLSHLRETAAQLPDLAQVHNPGWALPAWVVGIALLGTAGMGSGHSSAGHCRQG